MKRLRLLGLTMLLSACGSAGDFASDYAESEMASEELKAAGDEAAAEAGSGEIPVSTPQIAYSYSYGYRLPAADIPVAQQAHVTLCEQAGPKICRVINMERSGGEGEYASGMLQLEVKADRARAFGGQLSESIEEYGGEPIAAAISGEDLSKQIVDTEARLRSRRLLAQRLTELLATRKGSVGELVEAERAVTEVNEEIDRAESWLAEMRGRVAFSKVDVNYQSSSPGGGGFTGPIRDAWNAIAAILGGSIAALMMLIVGLLPWVVIVGLAIWLRLRFKSPDRNFWGRKLPADVTTAESNPSSTDT